METSRLMEMRGQPVYARDGDEIGEIEDIYLDDDTDEPVFIGLKSGGLFGAKHVLVPIEGASPQRDGLGVRYPKDRVRDAPEIDEEHITPEQMSELYAYYQLQGDGGMPGHDASESIRDSSEGMRWGDGDRDSAGMNMVDRTPGLGTDAEEQAETRRHLEREHSAGFEGDRGDARPVPAARIRIRKWVVTDRPLAGDARSQHAEVEGDNDLNRDTPRV